jgi:hypothetical protein
VLILGTNLWNWHALSSPALLVLLHSPVWKHEERYTYLQIDRLSLMSQASRRHGKDTELIRGSETAKRIHHLYKKVYKDVLCL